MEALYATELVEYQFELISMRTSRIKDRVSSGMLELPAFLDLRAAFST